MKKIWGIPDDRRLARSALGAAFVLMAFGTGNALAEGENQPQPKGGPAEVKTLRAEATGEAPGKSGEAKAKVAELKAEKTEKSDKADKADKGNKADAKKSEKKSDKGKTQKAAKTPAARADQARERLLAAAEAVAKDEDGDPDPKVRAERRAARRAYMKAQIELRQKAEKAPEKGEKKPGLSAEQKAELKAKADALTEERKKTAEKRIAEQKAQLKKSYSDSHLFRPIRNELRRHAWRVARLERAQDVAKASERQDLLERATKLLADEQARHDERMKQLVEIWKAAGKPKGEPFTPGAAKPAAPGAAAAPKPTTPTPAATKPAEGN
ncbi:MAG: hypothetical protein B6A08_19380 [Sorangiineae bacterium NIC37A_2]|nr:MAG: hypothetical protein B6A08_19380 [Sorangiineae bacterium NIC37A_2]